MSKRLWIVLVGMSWFMAAASSGQNPVMTSIRGNGSVSWTNTVQSNAAYRVEWAPDATGPWHRTLDNITSIDALTSTSFEAAVPMFFRVVMVTNDPPKGMVWIEGGDFVMGQEGVTNATPVHTNTVSAFWMDAKEVTKEEWDRVVAWGTTNGYGFNWLGSGRTNGHPVADVNWYDAVKWCNARSEMEGLGAVYYTWNFPLDENVYRTGMVDVSNEWVFVEHSGYRLPTEAEWEKAARGGRTQCLFPWGNAPVGHWAANYNADTNGFYPYEDSETDGIHPNYYRQDGTPYSSPVASFPGNACGLYDMSGNVAEWCWNWLGAYYAEHPTNSLGPNRGGMRIIRGGSWNDSASSALCSYRWYKAPEETSYKTGFRCVRKPDSP